MKWRLIFFWMKIYAYAKKKVEGLLTGSLLFIWNDGLYAGTELIDYARKWKKEVTFLPGDDKSHFDAVIDVDGVKFADVNINLTERGVYELHNREVRRGRV